VTTIHRLDRPRRLHRRSLLLSTLLALTVLLLMAAGPAQSANASIPPWTLQDSGTASTLFDVDFANYDTGWAVGANGTILRTTSDGNTWNAQSSGTGMTVYGVDAVSTSQGWVVGDRGTILRTSDGGRTWIPQSSGSLSRLSGVAFSSATVGCIVGYDGTILTTTNGGTTWAPRDSGTSEHLLDVDFVDSSDGWAVGRHGTILRTDDGGDSWTDVSPDNSADLSGVSFTTSSTGWVVGHGGNILRTIDAGMTWIQQSTGTANDLSGVCFPDVNNGWVVGTNGILLHTNDAGATWKAQASGTTQTLRRVTSTDGNHGWTVGDSGTILWTYDGGYDFPWMDVTGASNDWQPAPVVVTVAASVDSSLSMTAFQYSGDGGRSWQDMPGSGATRSLTFSDTGATYLELRVRDSRDSATSMSRWVKVDSVVPTVTVSAYDAVWHKEPVTLVFAPTTSGPSGVQSVQYRIGDGGWWWASASNGYAATISTSGEDIISYRAVSGAGVSSAVGTCTVKVDAAPPAAKAKKAALRKGKRGTIQLYVSKTPVGCGQAKVAIRIYKGAKLKKSFATGYLAVNTWQKASWRCTLPKGRYSMRLLATDLLGNKQTKAGTAILIIK
jgi:photosystem II stability/assembly factor-like uncharacterized protein